MPSNRDIAAVRAWRTEAIRRIEADYNRSADTHLIRLELPRYPGITLYLKDESSHPTGSLKHRLARSLFLYALCNGWIGPDTCVIEASSGSTAVSEAYFARMLGLRFLAVVPASTAAPKLDAIRFHGGEIHAVDDPRTVYDVAHRLAAETGGHYLDQFTYAERATDWRGNNNIAESIFAQMAAEEHSIPRWIVCGAGTGGTSATIGRFIGYRRHATQLCVADPVHSVFHRHFADRAALSLPGGCASCIEGIGRPRVEPSFIPSVIDRMIAVDDAASIGAMRALSRRLGRRVGGSTGTNLVAVAQLVEEMASRGEAGSIVSILCDGGDRYGCTYYDDAWLDARGLDWRRNDMAFDTMFAA
ncbi:MULTISPECIES: PLP-dependent cysteine synthase family protein [Sphingomonas]|jgi:cysteine synthase|uniref:L-cysteine desulfhydrase Cds1 n=1 Tax=Sphingomonas zeae TaxID=1646122 RepID=A0A7Y6B2F6_9SPHN|nr:MULTISPECIES: PLP-dependent cysteine synthase family protein [Sphingomonas]MBB4048515.1 cysteine synthase A [Sphingomonas zeae]MDK8187475.1 PLP-dependent cysteine synthase family protein [Sphingomonas zeae]MDK8217209.1 PLP-dependent cysteine synthase family protein [Sphingomonas sp. UMB7805-LC452B]NUU46199.1 PLP-dependent cysteine synthase family protein [Sphingomonas zeae]